MKHRKEEDDLYRKFARKREDEERKITSELQDEWERELERLTHKFEKELATSRRSREDQNILTLRHEQQKEDLEKNMTLRKTKKKESLTRKMLEHERSETAALVDRQSSEMLELISARRSEFMQNESIFLDDEFNETTQPLMSYPSVAPQPQPPAVSKFQIYTDPIEFEEVDRIAISVSVNGEFLLGCVIHLFFWFRCHFSGCARGSKDIHGFGTSIGGSLHIRYWKSANNFPMDYREKSEYNALWWRSSGWYTDGTVTRH